MKIKHIGYQLPGFYKVAAYATKYLNMGKTATIKFNTLEHARKYGYPAAADYAGVTTRTIYYWQERFNEFGVNGLQDNYFNMNRNPTKWDPRIIDEIRKLRTLYPNLGAKKIFVLLTEWCRENSLECPSSGTIERIISKAPDKMRTKVIGDKSKRVSKGMKKDIKKKGFKALYPGHCIAFDTIVRIINNQRFYILVAIDLYSRMAVAVAGSSHKSSFSAELLRQLPEIFNFKIERILTDNGSEFAKDFTTEVKKMGIKHMHTYPRTPKANAHCERFNRTLWEEFAKFQARLLSREKLQEFNKLLLDWLLWYNCKRPHAALENMTPIQTMIKSNFGNFGLSYTKSPIF